MSSRSRRKQRRHEQELQKKAAELASLPPSPTGEQRVAQLVAAASHVTFQGPLPPPGFLKAYDEVVPGAAQRMVDLWERQAHHRMGLEGQVIRSDIWKSWAGLACAFAIALVAMGFGAFLVLRGHGITGTVFAGATLATLVGTFIYGTERRKAERELKAGVRPRR